MKKDKHKNTQPKKIRLQKARQKQLKKQQKEQEFFDDFSDERFAFIAGYTEGGAPYGITWEELG